MIKILMQIKDNNIYFKVKRSLNKNEQNLLNTNIVSDNELVFTDEYIYQNLKVVTKLIDTLVNDSKVNTATIYNSKVTIEILGILKNISNITTLILKDDVQVTYKMCEKVIDTNIKLFSCYNIQDFLVEMLDKYDIKVESRSEIFMTSDFILNNDLTKYSSLFYKKSVNIDFPMTSEDKTDLEAFFKINKYLKVIHINKNIKSDLEELVNLLILYRVKNIRIILHENINDLSLVEYIKMINSKRKSHSIKITNSYTDEYLNQNFLPQTNVNILKLCLLIIIAIVSGSFGYVFVSNYIAFKEDEIIREEIQEVIKTADTEEIIKDIEDLTKKTVVNEHIASLLTVNKDVVGWLTVNNTKIDYPVLQADDNEYYLNKNIYEENDRGGWIYMDSNNNDTMTNHNTIFYGHTMYNSSVMFGTLINVKDENWRKNKDNLIIEYENLYGTFKYEIFSAYTIPVTTDYLVTRLSNDFEKLEFFNMLKDRSDYNFDADVTNQDKIITLSTCSNGYGNRLVVHAVLID